LRILVAHNFYQQPGGEDRVFANEKRLLVEKGHEVVEYLRHNSEIADYGIVKVAALSLAPWNPETYWELSSILRQFRPDVAHFHNTLPLISPSAYSACQRVGVAIVQSLHNYRPICPSGDLTYRGRPCEDCKGKLLPMPGILRGCYHNSVLQTGIVGLTTTLPRIVGISPRGIDRFIVFSSLYKEQLASVGFSPERVAVKPHFVNDFGIGKRSGGYALFAGRFETRKGLKTLLSAWKRIPDRRLTICGAGPLHEQVAGVAAECPGRVDLLPFLPTEELLPILKEAEFLVWPSEFPETFGMIALEAMACGVPVISSGNVSDTAGLVVDGRNGLTFRAGDAEDLAAKVEWAFEHPTEMTAMGERGRQMYLDHYTPEENYRQLIEIYQDAIRQRDYHRDTR